MIVTTFMLFSFFSSINYVILACFLYYSTKCVYLLKAEIRPYEKRPVADGIFMLKKHGTYLTTNFSVFLVKCPLKHSFGTYSFMLHRPIYKSTISPPHSPQNPPAYHLISLQIRPKRSQSQFDRISRTT